MAVSKRNVLAADVVSARVIHGVRWLQIQGRNCSAILRYAEQLITQEMQADRSVSGEHF